MRNEKSILGFNDEDKILHRYGINAVPLALATAFIILTAIFTTSCNKEQISPRTASPGNTRSLTGISPVNTGVQPVVESYYTHVNLVSDVKAFDATYIDTNLVDAWGMAFGPEGRIWIASNHKGLAAAFNENGLPARLLVDIPLHGMHFGSSPSGIVYNDTRGFLLPDTREKSNLIFATEDGIIAAWNSGLFAITVADRSSTGAVYKGIALAAGHLYATNFNSGQVDMFDESFRYERSFTDPGVPAGFAPFNIKLVDDKLYVTFARQNSLRHDDEAGPGNGYVSVFNVDGSFLSRFASQGTLNSPWGMAEMEAAKDGNEKILIGNFGDGRINIFSTDGKYEGQLMGRDGPLTIPGLWGLAFSRQIVAPAVLPAFETSHLYFTAGPDNENHGLFGYVEPLPRLTPVAATSVRPVPVNKTP